VLVVRRPRGVRVTTCSSLSTRRTRPHARLWRTKSFRRHAGETTATGGMLAASARLVAASRRRVVAASRRRGYKRDAMHCTSQIMQSRVYAEPARPTRCVPRLPTASDPSLLHLAPACLLRPALRLVLFRASADSSKTQAGSASPHCPRTLALSPQHVHLCPRLSVRRRNRPRPWVRRGNSTLRRGQPRARPDDQDGPRGRLSTPRRSRGVQGARSVSDNQRPWPIKADCHAYAHTERGVTGQGHRRERHPPGRALRCVFRTASPACIDASPR